MAELLPGMPCGHSVKFFCAAAAIDNRCSLNLVLASDTPERLVSEVSFAALCGTSPVEASPGKTQRRRSNRGGDRQANAALYRIVLSRSAGMPAPRTTCGGGSPRGSPVVRSSAASSGTEWLEQARRVRAALSALGEGVAERLPGEPVDCAVSESHGWCRMEAGSDVALRHAGRACTSFALKRRRLEGQTAAPGTAGPAGTVASTEGPAPHGRGTRRPQGRPPHQDPGPRIAAPPPRTRTKTYFCRRTFS